MHVPRNETGKGFTGLFDNVLECIRVNMNVDPARSESPTIGSMTIIPIGIVSYGFGRDGRVARGPNTWGQLPHGGK